MQPSYQQLRRTSACQSVPFHLPSNASDGADQPANSLTNRASETRAARAPTLAIMVDLSKRQGNKPFARPLNPLEIREFLGGRRIVLFGFMRRKIRRLRDHSLETGEILPNFDADSFDCAEVRISRYQRKLILLSVGGNPNVVLWNRAAFCSQQVSDLPVMACR